jgi:hypothetical protein
VNDIDTVISELEQQRTAIDRAISALRQVAQPDHSTNGADSQPKAGAKVTRRRLSAAGRRRIAEAARRRWAEIRAAKSALATEPKKSARKKTAAKKAVVTKRASAKKTGATKT